MRFLPQNLARPAFVYMEAAAAFAQQGIKLVAPQPDGDGLYIYGSSPPGHYLKIVGEKAQISVIGPKLDIKFYASVLPGYKLVQFYPLPYEPGYEKDHVIDPSKEFFAFEYKDEVYAKWFDELGNDE